MILSGYLAADLTTVGMPSTDQGKFYSRGLSPLEKWRLLEPYWPAVKNNGCGQAARISLRQLYGVEELSAKTVEKAQASRESAASGTLRQDPLRGSPDRVLSGELAQISFLGVQDADDRTSVCSLLKRLAIERRGSLNSTSSMN